MTTISYKNGIIAYDSRLCTGELIQDDDFEKQIVMGSKHFFICGLYGQAEEFIQVYNGGTIDPEVIIDVEAIIYDCVAGTLTRSAIDYDGKYPLIFRDNLHLNKCYSIGSGRRLALAAMDMGANAEYSIKIAASRDIYTGGVIKTFELGRAC